MKFTAYLYKIQKDQDGEVKIIFVIPKTEVTSDLMNIPEEKNLEITIEEANGN